MNHFLDELKTTLDSYFDAPGSASVRSITWAVAALEREDCWIIKAQMDAETTSIDEAEIPGDLRRLVIWRFSPDGQTAWIKLQKPLDWPKYTAQLMVGNLFGQGLTEEQANETI